MDVAIVHPEPNTVNANVEDAAIKRAETLKRRIYQMDEFTPNAGSANAERPVDGD